MKIIIAIIVYDRINNVENWIRCWRMCRNVDEAQLIIIQNIPNEELGEECRLICENNNIKYIPRNNAGLDIGAFQDVCRGRLEGFPNEWDYLLWVTDDVIPMSKKFLTYYLELIRKNNMGAVCLEISNEVKTHIRTTGFMVSQLTASKITFPVDPVLTKDHCYQFEHRSTDAFLEQIEKMGKNVVQVHPDLKKSCLWDSHIRAHLRRKNEHFQNFPK